jgi:hypothetical protein
VDCDEPVRVPDSPILVLKVRREPGTAKPTEGEAKSFAERFFDALKERQPPKPRRCILCRRNIRNPTNYCYKCRPW